MATGAPRPGGLRFWSQITIPGRPSILFLDASEDAEGWEREFADRLFTVYRRKGIALATDAPVRVVRPADISPHLIRQEGFNSILLFGHGGERTPEERRVGTIWRWFLEQQGLSPKLFALVTAEDADLATSQAILDAKGSFAKLAVAPLTPLTPRGAGLFFMKFFAELDLHSEAEGTVTGTMVWFSHSKAKVLTARRHYAGEVGMRC
jgi:hypothetical protein